MAWPRVPAMQTRSEDFDRAVLESLERLEHRIKRPLDMLEVAVEDVPAHDPAPWESDVALGRSFPGHGGAVTRIVIYRRPIEARTFDRDELSELIDHVVAEQVADVIGIHPDDLQD